MEPEVILRKYEKALHEENIHIPTEALNVLERVLLIHSGSNLLLEPIDRDMLKHIEETGDYPKKGTFTAVYNSLRRYLGRNALNIDVLNVHKKGLPLKNCGRVGRKVIEEYLKNKELID